MRVIQMTIAKWAREGNDGGREGRRDGGREKRGEKAKGVSVAVEDENINSPPLLVLASLER